MRSAIGILLWQMAARPGHASPTIAVSVEAYVMPGMQRAAAAVFTNLVSSAGGRPGARQASATCRETHLARKMTLPRAPDLQEHGDIWCPRGDLNPHALFGH